MSDSTTLRLQSCLDRLNGGDSSARAELLEGACERLRRLTHTMLKDYRGVQRWEETGDVLQNAMLRLCRALDATSPPTVRDFLRLAALQVRRELIDLARHYYGPEGRGAHHASQGPEGQNEGSLAPRHEAADLSLEPTRIAVWTEFHRTVETLPDEEREVFDLLFYQGLAQAEAAALLGMAERTLKRRWQSARLKLHEALGGEMPEI